ncbi:MAG: biopolymer transporter ExbD [Bacteroidales bacterium]|nr:biopolymer transporter ExbD [Bacteroidales bacterium]
MAIELQNKRKADFNSSSMSDLVFLLLIFFMITSTLVSPNAINLTLPSSDSGKQLASKNVEVYINAEKQYFVNPTGNHDAPIALGDMLPVLQDAVSKDDSGQNSIVLRADKSVPIENVVALMDVVNKLNEARPENERYKIVLATEAE